MINILCRKHVTVSLLLENLEKSSDLVKLRLWLKLDNNNDDK